jgi:hypothetical protein
MTEAEWLTCDDPKRMVTFLRESGLGSERKLRLFSCACVRRAWRLLTDVGRQAVEAAEAYADGRIGVETLRLARRAAYEPVADAMEAADLTWALGTPLTPPESAAVAAVEACGDRDSDNSRYSALLEATSRAQAALGWKGSELAAQATLLRDVLGNPFRPPPPPPAAILAWNDGGVSRIAQRLYEDRAFDRLPILADALEDAGCTDAAILSHCRWPSQHFRGCWAVDLILGRS